MMNNVSNDCVLDDLLICLALIFRSAWILCVIDALKVCVLSISFRFILFRFIPRISVEHDIQEYENGVASTHYASVNYNLNCLSAFMFAYVRNTMMCVLSLCVGCSFNVLSHPYRNRRRNCVYVSHFSFGLCRAVRWRFFLSLFIHLLSFHLAVTRYHSLCNVPSHSGAARSRSLSRMCLYRYFTENVWYYVVVVIVAHENTKTKQETCKGEEPIGKYEIIYGKIN